MFRSVSKLLLGNGKQCDIIVYTDNHSLYDAVNYYETKPKKRLFVDIATIIKIMERNEI